MARERHDDAGGEQQQDGERQHQLEGAVVAQEPDRAADGHADQQAEDREDRNEIVTAEVETHAGGGKGADQQGAKEKALLGVEAPNPP